MRASQPFLVSPAEERRVIVASSVGTVFEWYDFYLYAVLAPFFAKLFFPGGNDTAALMATFATYAAGFVVRPFGAVFLGRLGDLVGRKYTFLLSIVFMGFATFTIGLLPTFDQVGWLAPILLASLRLLQGLALGGEYGGAATYVAEYTDVHRRGYATSWIQTTATFGLLLAFVVVGVCRWKVSKDDFEHWAWRIPFIISIVLLLFSVYIRLTLRETPVFLNMKAEGSSSKNPVWESFFRSPNNRYIVLSLLGATAGQGVVLYTGQFYTLFFLIIVLNLDYLTAYVLVGLALAATMPFFVVFGWLSDKIGRLRIILMGCLLAALTYIPLFQTLSAAVNPALIEFQKANRITLSTDARSCHFHLFIGPWSSFSLCDLVADYLTKSGLSFVKSDTPDLDSVVVSIERVDARGGRALKRAGDATQTVEIAPSDKDRVNRILQQMLFAAGYPGLDWQYVNGEPQTDASGNPILEQKSPEVSKADFPLAFAALFIMGVYTTMVYGPIAAFLVELFPPKVRYTSLSFPYHIGNGIFGGMLPLVATALVAGTGNVYAGLWYPISVAAMSFVIGLVFLREKGPESRV